MAALTSDYDAPFIDKGPVNPYAMAAGAKIFAGAIVALNAAGYAVRATDTAGLKVIGRAEEQKDNTAGADAGQKIKVAAGIFRFPSTGASKLDLTDLDGDCFVLDDNTVVKVAGAPTAGIRAGRVVRQANINQGEPADHWYVALGVYAK